MSAVGMKSKTLYAALARTSPDSAQLQSTVRSSGQSVFRRCSIPKHCTQLWPERLQTVLNSKALYAALANSVSMGVKGFILGQAMFCKVTKRV